MSSASHTLIAEWPRNSRETICVALDEYNGRPIIDVRTWWRDETGELRPGRSGITLSVGHLPALAKALNEALATAIGLGLVEAPATKKDATAAERQRRYRDRRKGVTGRDVTAANRDSAEEEFALTT